VPPREWRLRIEDILDAAARVLRYTDRMDLATFVADDLTLDAVSRCFGIIGEAATHIPKEVIAAHPEIPWAEMRAMRNIVVHEYFGVTTETLWKTAREDLPAIVEPLRKLLEAA
jgi:uncharacterized protein with HEPN domain